MHIGGMGDAAMLAAGVKKVYDKIAEIRAAQPCAAEGFHGGTSLAELDHRRSRSKRYLA